ncbi:MAG: hypothetical protein Q8R18_05260 [bacterium]|nr:hypothetical protein [bacterium]
MVLENIVGNLRDAYALTEPGTMLHSDELQRESFTNIELRNLPFYTADGNLYDMHEGKARLSITRQDHNLVLRHIDTAFAELTSSGNYHPAREEALEAIAADSTVSIDLTQLRLQGDNAEWRYLAIPTRNYDTLNSEERKLAERVHGSGYAFMQVMKMLADARVKETRVYVLNLAYVQENTQEGPVGRASWLNDFGSDSDFGANGRDINGYDRLRGVRRRVASVSEPGAHEAENPFIGYYNQLIANPEQAVADLNDETASGLRKILLQYDSRK